MVLYTIGYGGRTPEELLGLLKTNGIRSVVDVRLRPDRSSMGIYAKAKDASKGIQRLLADAGFEYISLAELGNVFHELDDWPARYRRLLEEAGELLTDRLKAVPEPACLMCAEKRAAHCHRGIIADFLRKKGHPVVHIE